LPLEYEIFSATFFKEETDHCVTHTWRNSGGRQESQAKLFFQQLLQLSTCRQIYGAGATAGD
jgi:hypothetical protein